jgi:hypothetical protein
MKLVFFIDDEVFALMVPPESPSVAGIRLSISWRSLAWAIFARR